MSYPEKFSKSKQHLTEVERNLLNSEEFVPIDSNMLFFDENILAELAAHYEWSDMQEYILDAGNEAAFRHFLAYGTAVYIDNNSVEKFLDTFQGFYDSTEDFVEELFDCGNIPELPVILRNNIDWRNVAIDLDRSGAYSFVCDCDCYENVYVFSNM